MCEVEAIYEKFVSNIQEVIAISEDFAPEHRAIAALLVFSRRYSSLACDPQRIAQFERIVREQSEHLFPLLKEKVLPFF